MLTHNSNCIQFHGRKKWTALKTIDEIIFCTFSLKFRIVLNFWIWPWSFVKHSSLKLSQIQIMKWDDTSSHSNGRANDRWRMPLFRGWWFCWCRTSSWDHNRILKSVGWCIFFHFFEYIFIIWSYMNSIKLFLDSYFRFLF